MLIPTQFSILMYILTTEVSFQLNYVIIGNGNKFIKSCSIFLYILIARDAEYELKIYVKKIGSQFPCNSTVIFSYN